MMKYFNQWMLVGLFIALSLSVYNIFAFKQDLKSRKTELTTQRIIIKSPEGIDKFIINSENNTSTLSMLDDDENLRYQLAIDEEGTLSHFLFDEQSTPRQGWFIRNDGVALNYQDGIEYFQPESNITKTATSASY